MQPITDKVIAEVTRRIIAELDPEEVILFGSYAWGTPHKKVTSIYASLCLMVFQGLTVLNGVPGVECSK